SLLRSRDLAWLNNLMSSIYLPKAATGPVPAFLGLNFVGNQCVANDPGVPLTTRWVRSTYTKEKDNHADETSRGLHSSRWQVETVLMRGYATATAYYGDIEEDHPEGWKNGVRGELLRRSSKTQFAQDDWGAVSAWAWGLSRALDYLETDASVDAERVIVHGHSRLGKAALWAGAQDERFAIVISNNSGEGGASLMRRDFGETIAIANGWEPHRFCQNFRRYNHAANSLPVDSHLLIALAAPRPVYVASASEDLLADPKGEFLAAKAAEPVYRLFGKVGITSAEMPIPDRPIGNTVGYHLRTGKHDITGYDWAQYLEFADRRLRGQTALPNSSAPHSK
ncbi:MAG: acetylxylan esterase, partial [Verrucomicrobiota bacterium]